MVQSGVYTFAAPSFQQIINESYRQIQNLLNKESESYILNINETEYIKHLEKRFSFDTPKIHYENVSASTYEILVEGKDFPDNIHVDRSKSYKKSVIEYFLPCTGDASLLNYKPASIKFVGNEGQFRIVKNDLILDVINFFDDVDLIGGKFEFERNALQYKSDFLLADINEYNAGLTDNIRVLFVKRKTEILTKNKILASLKVPIRVKENIPETFLIPILKLREKIVIKPAVQDEVYISEPTLGDEEYLKILRYINDSGKNFERMPSIYKKKSENDLRDHILFNLDPHFEYGSATGETFNKEGKTDILLRYDSSVVFIAECKFWSGEQKYLETISQLLGYLTWRDSKASIIVFVRQKSITSVIEKVKLETAKHPNFLRFVNLQDEGWFNYFFHINGDKNREVKLAVQLFHIPNAKN